MKRTSVLEMGREVLDAGRASIQAFQSGGQDALELIERYVELLSVWQAQCGGTLGLEGGSDQAQRPTARATSQEGQEARSPEAVLLQALSDQHTQILKMVGELRGDMSEALRALHERGRGMKAYTDIFPMRISTTRVRKG